MAYQPTFNTLLLVGFVLQVAAAILAIASAGVSVTDDHFYAGIGWTALASATASLVGSVVLSWETKFRWADKLLNEPLKRAEWTRTEEALLTALGEKPVTTNVVQAVDARARLEAEAANTYSPEPTFNTLLFTGYALQVAAAVLLMVSAGFIIQDHVFFAGAISRTALASAIALFVGSVVLSGEIKIGWANAELQTPEWKRDIAYKRNKLNVAALTAEEMMAAVRKRQDERRKQDSAAREFWRSQAESFNIVLFFGFCLQVTSAILAIAGAGLTVHDEDFFKGSISPTAMASAVTSLFSSIFLSGEIIVGWGTKQWKKAERKLNEKELQALVDERNAERAAQDAAAHALLPSPAVAAQGLALVTNLPHGPPLTMQQHA